MTFDSAPAPTVREVRIAAALIVAAGLVASGLAIFGGELGLGAEVARDRLGWQRGLLLFAGCVAVPIGTLLVARPQIASRINWERMRGFLGHLAIGLLLLLGIAFVWTRLIRIDQSFWHDEAFTVLNYSGVGPRAILFGEGTTFDINNHVAYNLLSWATTSLLRESEAMYRLWSVVPGIAAIGLATWWAWRRLGAIIAIAFAALAVAAPMHLELAPQARGYGLALLAATLMLIAADRLTRAYSKRMFAGFLAAGLLGIGTLFIFVIAFVGQALALLRWPRLRRPVILVVGTAGLLSLALYAPVLGRVLEARAMGETISLPAALVLDRPLDWMVLPIVTLFTGDASPGWMSLAALALVVLALVALWRRRDPGLALLLVLPPLLFNLVFAIAGLETVERHQFLLFTHVLLLFAVGIGELGRALTRYRPLRPVALGAGVVAVLALSIATVERQQRAPEPFENFKQAASTAEWSGISPIVTDSLSPEGLRHYLGDDLVELAPEEVESLLCARGQEVVYIRRVQILPPEWDFWSPASLDCVAERPSVRVRVPQRRSDAQLDVWIVGPRLGRDTLAEEL